MGTENLLDLIKQRTSCRNYLPDAVPDEMLDRCLDTVRQAPSACNKQPWRIIIARNAKIRAQICQHALLPGIPMPWLATAPVIIALCVKKSFITHTIAPMVSGIKYQLIDAGIAGEHFVLAAEAQGLGTCWIGWFKPRQIKKILHLPFNVHPVCLISLGFPDKKTEPGSRLPAEELFHYDKW